jgi:hypothetical protein
MAQHAAARRPIARKRLCLAIASALAVGWPVPAASQPAPAAQRLPAIATVDVVGATPLPGLDLPRDQVPANVQTLDSGAATGPDSANLPDALNRRLGSVYVNEIQGNPFQPDLNFRGFTASPLLGTPQGLSVYLDGVRINQPFGDVVSWDLIPRAAIASVTLMPGSNPLFGLNTLGGALAIRTKDGLHRGAGRWPAAMAAPRSSSSTAATTPAAGIGTLPAAVSATAAGATPRRPGSASCSARPAGPTAAPSWR